MRKICAFLIRELNNYVFWFQMPISSSQELIHAVLTLINEITKPRQKFKRIRRIKRKGLKKNHCAFGKWWFWQIALSKGYSNSDTPVSVISDHTMVYIHSTWKLFINYKYAGLLNIDITPCILPSLPRKWITVGSSKSHGERWHILWHAAMSLVFTQSAFWDADASFWSCV